MDIENRLVVAKGKGKGVGWMGSVGLVDANYCSQSNSGWISNAVLQSAVKPITCDGTWWKIT